MTSLNDPAQQRTARGQPPATEPEGAPPAAEPESVPSGALSVIAPVDSRGHHELLRLAAGLAPALHSPAGDALEQAIIALGVKPAPVERMVTSVRDIGAIALVDGALFALGSRSFLDDIGVRPRIAEVRMAERIERPGARAYFVVAVARGNCIGVIGVLTEK
jgi:cation transport ATPase